MSKRERICTLPSYDKNGHVDLREALLVHHRVHNSLSDSSLEISDCKALQPSWCSLHQIRPGLLVAERDGGSIRLVTSAAAKFCP